MHVEANVTWLTWVLGLHTAKISQTVDQNAYLVAKSSFNSNTDGGILYRLTEAPLLKCELQQRDAETFKYTSEFLSLCFSIQECLSSLCPCYCAAANLLSGLARHQAETEQLSYHHTSPCHWLRSDNHVNHGEGGRGG